MRSAHEAGADQTNIQFRWRHRLALILEINRMRMRKQCPRSGE